MTAFLVGYNQAARRHGGRGLDGWREWLIARHQVGTNLVWEAQIQQIALGRPDLTPEEEIQVTDVLFDLLDQFLAEQEDARTSRRQEQDRTP